MLKARPLPWPGLCFLIRKMAILVLSISSAVEVITVKPPVQNVSSSAMPWDLEKGTASPSCFSVEGFLRKPLGCRNTHACVFGRMPRRLVVGVWDHAQLSKSARLKSSA